MVVTSTPSTLHFVKDGQRAHASHPSHRRRLLQSQVVGFYNPPTNFGIPSRDARRPSPYGQASPLHSRLLRLLHARRKLERREGLTQALRREIDEELGLEIDAPTIREAFVERSTAYGLVGVNLQMHCFTGNAVGEPRPDREIAELSWVVPNDRHCCAPAVQQILDRLFSIRGMPIGRLLRLG
jgi:8-oxo-dGTP diphosphatase